jgi:hypothetical protein
MNYLEIVLKGYFDENNREYLEKYFFREFKKAEKESFFDADEFFNGCLKVIKEWEKYLEEKVFKRKTELFFMLNAAENGTLSYGNLEEKAIEQKRVETIEYCKDELKSVRPDGIGSLTFTVHLSSLTNGIINYNMPYNELLFIKGSILKAFLSSKNIQQAKNPEPTEEIGQAPRKYRGEHYALAFIFDCNSIGESIPYGSKTELEKIGRKRVNGAISGNTFYKRVSEIFKQGYDLNSQKSLIEIAGEDWKEIMLELSKYPEELQEYLQSKQL